MRNKIAGMCLSALVLGVPLLTGCTAKYQRLLDERDREIVSLKDERARLQVELRSQKEHEESLQGRLKLLAGEKERLLAAQKSPPPATAAPAPRAGAVDPGLRQFAQAHGLEVQQRPEGAVVVLPGAITFQSGSVALSKRGKEVLDRLAALIQRDFANRTLSVEGHTDSEPIRKSKFGTNWRLSAERAEVVRAYLSAQGAGKKSEVRVVGYGPTQPAASNRAETGRQKNRRVEVVILNA